MSYTVELSDTARASIKALNKQTARRITQKLEQVKEQPFNYVKRLTGISLFSLRVGDYRVIMDIKTNQMLIFVMRIGHRKNVYDKH
jgi:mRNA interferase RelE/StbE